MAALDTVAGGSPGDTWTWWQARRLRYNLVLAIAGWLAYLAAVGLSYGFGRPMWQSWRGALGETLFLGTAYLVLMGVANGLYLLGPAVEAWLRPGEVASFRRTAFGMGLWGSAVLPFVFPLAYAAAAIGAGG